MAPTTKALQAHSAEVSCESSWPITLTSNIPRGFLGKTLTKLSPSTHLVLILCNSEYSLDLRHLSLEHNQYVSTSTRAPHKKQNVLFCFKREIQDSCKGNGREPFLFSLPSSQLCMQHETAPVQTAVPLNVCGLVTPTAPILLLQACEREKRGREKT